MNQPLSPSEPVTAEPGVLWRLAKAAAPLLLVVPFFLTDFALCPAKHLFGAPCPGCGLTRATESAFAGEFAAALAYHPLMPIITPLVAWMILRSILVTAGVLRAGSWDPISKLPQWFWGALALLVIVVWIIRLSGGLGGHPDPVVLNEGFVFRLLGLF